MKRILPLLALAAPLAAQSFADGPAFGGSRTFSEGLSVKGNPARFDQAQPGWYLGWEGGDDKPRGFQDASDRFAATADAGAFADLAKRPYGERRTAYGLAVNAQGGLYVGLGRELLSAVHVVPDATAPGTGGVEVGRAVINRLVMGAGSGTEGQAYGFALRLERLETGRALLPLDAITSAGSALAFQGTDRTNTALTLDLGAQFAVVQGLKVALTGDRLLPRTFNGVREKAQFHAGVSLDLGPTAALVVESDLNRAQRLPLPVDQRSAGASLRFAFSPNLSLKVGAQRKTVDGQDATLLGASLTLRSAPLHLTFGFQFGDDRPTRALALKVDG